MKFVRFQRRFTAAILAGITALILFVPAALAEDGDRKVRTKVAPTYPDLARRLNIAGTVKIELTIAPSGTVKNTKVIGGHPLLVGAAEEALKRWKYEPSSSETTTVVELHFTPGT